MPDLSEWEVLGGRHRSVVLGPGAPRSRIISGSGATALKALSDPEGEAVSTADSSARSNGRQSTAASDKIPATGISAHDRARRG